MTLRKTIKLFSIPANYYPKTLDIEIIPTYIIADETI